MTRGALQARQTLTLVWKNIIIVLFRHAFSTPLRCFLLPVIFTGFLAYARNVRLPLRLLVATMVLNRVKRLWQLLISLAPTALHLA